MIFICTGTQIYQFNRLLSKIDDLIEDGSIDEMVFAQTGASTYIPRSYAYKEFLSHEEFEQQLDCADLVISHAGTGSLIGSLKKGKNVIAVPRLSEFKEHIDNHQLQIADVLELEGYIRVVKEIESLGDVISDAKINPIRKPYNRESNILGIITQFIEQNI